MSFRNLMTLCLLVAFCFSSLVCAEGKWVSLDGTTNKPTPVQVKVLENTANQVKLELTVAGYFENTIKVEDQEVVALHIPQSAQLMLKGFPMVPLFSTLVKVHDYCKVELKVLEKEEVEKELTVPIIPSRGHFNRNIDPSTVPFVFGPIYKENVFWPAEEKQVTIGHAFLLRDVRGVRLQFLPIRANHVEMKMKIAKKVVLTLTHEGTSEENVKLTRSVNAPSKTFKKIYETSFANYTAPATRGPEEGNKKLVVIVPAAFENGIQAWVAWKKKCGYEVTVNAIADGTSAGTIKAYLQGLYDNTATRFGYVVLVGDAGSTTNWEAAKPMPTFKGKMEGAAADRVYVRLAGNDNYPDAFVSRISANSASEVEAQLKKIMDYEASAGGDWTMKGVCIASNQGSPDDKTRTEWLQNGGGNDQKVPVVAGGLIKAGFTTFDDIYDPTASASMVTNAVNNGRGIICYIGHGSSTSWVSSGFNTSHIKSLTNGGMLPVIWSVACVNGDFVKTAECFAEGWLRKVNGGAVAMEAGSTNESWVPPCDKQAATVNAIINKTFVTFGALEHAGVLAGLKSWGDSDKTEGNKMAEQCNLFGDCTMIVKTKKGVALSTNSQRGLDNNLMFNITSENQAVNNATVTVYNQDLSFVVTGETSEDGSVSLSLENAPANAKLFYTVVGQDLEPQVDIAIE